MGLYIVRRLLITLPMLLGITIVTFFFINLAPGDPISAMINPNTAETLVDYEKIRERLGLNRPLPVRYAIWLGQLLTGNFGFSYHSGEPVLTVVGKRLIPTLELTVTALVLSTVFGTLFGVIAALKQYSIYDYGLSVVSLFGVSVPTFFFALVALYVFAATLEIMPTFGMYNLEEGFSIWSNLHHLIMPAFVLSIDSMAGNTRYARTAMLEVMRSDYVTTARAKGLSENMVIARHAFRNTAAAAHHDNHAPSAQPDRGRLHHRVHVHMAGDGAAWPFGHNAQGLLGLDGPDLLHGVAGAAGQPACGHSLRIRRPANPGLGVTRD